MNEKVLAKCNEISYIEDTKLEVSQSPHTHTHIYIKWSLEFANPSALQILSDVCVANVGLEDKKNLWISAEIFVY